MAGILGIDALGTLTLGEGINTLTDDSFDVAYLLCIEGIGSMWVSDHTGDVLLGSGSNSWIGQYEQDALYTAHETVGNRVVRAGLTIPSQIQKGRLNPKTGQLESTSLTLDLLDVDGILPALFASEGKDFNTLGARVAPGTAALAATITIEGAATIDPADRYLGIERIGPARERAWFYPWPFQGIGYHHQVNQNTQDLFAGPPPVRVSTEPLEHAGRKVVLWKLYRSNSNRTAVQADWAHWGDQYALGPPEFFGVLRDAGEYRGDGVWRIQCFGPESLLRRRMGTFDAQWMPVSGATLALAAAEREIAIAYFTIIAGVETDWNSVDFGTLTDLPATGTAADYIDDIDQALTDVGDGTAAGWGGSAAFSYAFSTGSSNVIALMDSSGLQIKRPADGTNGRAEFRICMHERVWRHLGYEPALQKIQDFDTFENDRQIRFQETTGWYTKQASGLVEDEATPPGPGYWTAIVSTVALGSTPKEDQSEADNDGDWRVYRPLYSETPVILPGSASGQVVSLGESFPYIETDPTVDSLTYDEGRYFVFRGQRAVATVSSSGQIFDTEGNLLDDVEAEPFAAVAEVHWNRDGSTYGTVGQSASGSHVVTIHRWVKSRKFGVDHPTLAGEWSALAAGEYSIECAPLHAYAYREAAEGEAALDRSWAVFGQLLMSTGTATGWSGGVYSAGANQPTVGPSTFWCGDIVTSELGLAIPYQLVQSPASILAAFDDVPGGAHGELNRVRYAYAEPFQSADLFDSLLRSRGLSFSLAGGQFGAVKLGLFEPGQVGVVSIVETDVALGSPNDPSSEPTTQQLRATGGVDAVILSARLDPSTGEHVIEETFPSRDPGARYRRGDIEEPITDDGLHPGHWAVGSSGWIGLFRQLHSIDRATWLNQRHFLVRTTLHRVSGQNLWVGAPVSFSSERVYTAAGVLGMNNSLGHIISVTARPKAQEYDVELLIYAGQLRLSLFSPIGKVASISGTAVTLTTDAQFLVHESGIDANKFVRPSWLSTGGVATVQLLEYDREGWTLRAEVDRVVSVAGNTVTTLSGFTNVHANRDYYLVVADHGNQQAASWPLDVLLPYLDDTLQFYGTTDGWPYLVG